MGKVEKSAGAVIYYIASSEPRFLLVKSNYWGFVKGWIESGESIEQTAKREAKEEVNLDLTFIQGFKETQHWVYRWEGNLVNKETIFLLAQITKEQSKQVKISDEHSDLGFFTLEQALGKMKIKNNKELIEKAYKFIKGNEKQKTLI